MTVTITREVISDLLPLYFAGEASPDTARLVENYLAQDPELAARATFAERKSEEADTVPNAMAEKRALEGARRILHSRQVLFGLAFAFTLTPFAFSFANGRITWWMMRDSPIQAVVLLLAGLVCWGVYAVLGYSARRVGF